MATIVIDELVTKLEYKADVKTIESAEKAVKQLEKTNEDTAKATDLLTREQLALAEQIAKSQAKTDKLRDRQKELRGQIQRVGKATKSQRLELLSLNNSIESSQKKTRDLRNDSAALARQKQRLGVQSRKLAADQRKLVSAVRSASESMREETSVIDSLGEKIAGVAGGELAADAVRAVAGGVFELGKEVVTTGANFESLRARLKTVEGSSEGAAKAFGLIQDFTKTTPFQLEEVTTAFVRLKSLGLDASKESLTAFGNLSAAQGKSIIDFIEAVADASTGEFERLKEFGIKASSQGDKVAFTFKGQTTTVGKNAKDIQAFLRGIGETEFAGAMADQMATLNGAFSNFQDTIAQFFDQIAQLGVLDEMKMLLSELSSAAGGEGLAGVLADILVTALRTVRGLLEALPQEQLASFFGGIVDVVKVLAEQFVNTAADGSGFIGTLVDTAASMLELAAAAGSLIQGVQQLGEELPSLPGVLDLVFGALELTLKAMSFFADLLTQLIGLIEPFITSLKDMAESASEALPSFDRLNGLLESVGLSASKTAKDYDDLATSIDGTTSSAMNAVNALQALADKQAQQREEKAKEDDVGKAKARAQEKQKVIREREREAKGKLGSRPDELSRTELNDIANDFDLSEKTRAKARKELDKRDKKRKTAGAAAAKKARKELVTVQVEKQIEDLAKTAGQREASRALLRGESAARANELQRAKQKEVQARFTQQFEETGRLPPGLATSLTQTAALPDVEKVAGPVSAPVLTVNNYRTEVTGNTIVNEVNIAGSVSATPEQITGAIAQSQAVTFEHLGAAIIAKTTNLRR